MPTYLADDIFEARVEGITANLTRWNNVIHYRLNADTETNKFELALELAQSVFTTYAAAFSAYMNDQVTLNSCRATAIYPQTGVPAVFIPSSPTPGDLLIGGLPPDVAAVITKRTDMPGRTFLGRMYLTGLDQSIVTDDLIDEATAQSMANSAESLLADPITLSTSEILTPVVASRKLMTALTVARDAAADIKTVEVDRVTRNLGNRGLSQRIPVSGLEN